MLGSFLRCPTGTLGPAWCTGASCPRNTCPPSQVGHRVAIGMCTERSAVTRLDNGSNSNSNSNSNSTREREIGLGARVQAEVEAGVEVEVEAGAKAEVEAKAETEAGAKAEAETGEEAAAKARPAAACSDRTIVIVAVIAIAIAAGRSRSWQLRAKNMIHMISFNKATMMTSWGVVHEKFLPSGKIIRIRATQATRNSRAPPSPLWKTPLNMGGQQPNRIQTGLEAPAMARSAQTSSNSDNDSNRNSNSNSKR